MVWGSGRPASHIPETAKRVVRHRQGNRCNTIDPTVCLGTIQQYDHVANLKATRTPRSQANDPDLLQGLCIPCHKIKTNAEAIAGRRRGKRPPPPHPSDG